MARSVEAKLTGLDTQLEVGNIIIPDGTLQYHVRYAKYEANNNGVSLIFHEGETKMFTTKLYRVNIQQLIPLCYLKNSGMSIMEVIGVIQKMNNAYFEKAEQHWYYFRSGGEVSEF